MSESFTLCGVGKSAPLLGRQGESRGGQRGQVRGKEQLQQAQGNKQRHQGIANEEQQHVLGNEQPEQGLGNEHLEQARAAGFTGKRAVTIMVT